MVSLTAAKTSRILVVSVACVRLCTKLAPSEDMRHHRHSLRIEVELGTIHLIEPPEEVFGGSIDVVASGVIREIIPQW